MACGTEFRGNELGCLCVAFVLKSWCVWCVVRQNCSRLWLESVRQYLGTMTLASCFRSHDLIEEQNRELCLLNYKCNYIKHIVIKYINVMMHTNNDTHWISIILKSCCIWHSFPRARVTLIRLWSKSKSWPNCREVSPIYAHSGKWFTPKLSEMYRSFWTKTKFVRKERPCLQIRSI